MLPGGGIAEILNVLDGNEFEFTIGRFKGLTAAVFFLFFAYSMSSVFLGSGQRKKSQQDFLIMEKKRRSKDSCWISSLLL